MTFKQLLEIYIFSCRSVHEHVVFAVLPCLTDLFLFDRAVTSQAVITRLSTHHQKASPTLGWAAGGKQVQGKINAIWKVPSTQFQCGIVSSRESEVMQQRIKVVTQLDSGKALPFYTDCHQ